MVIEVETDPKMLLIEALSVTGNGFGAWLKMAAIVSQRCGNLSRMSDGATQAVTAHVLGRLTPAR